jgi:hypothetical protein
MRAAQSVHLADGAIRHLIYMYRGPWRERYRAARSCRRHGKKDVTGDESQRNPTPLRYPCRPSMRGRSRIGVYTTMKMPNAQIHSVPATMTLHR